jgi:hypothetical protein
MNLANRLRYESIQRLIRLEIGQKRRNELWAIMDSQGFGDILFDGPLPKTGPRTGSAITTIKNLLQRQGQRLRYNNKRVTLEKL